MSDAHDGENAPETITVWVVLSITEHEAAESFAKCYADEGLEEVFVAFARDLAALRAGRRGFELSWVLGWLVCHPWPRDGAAGTEGAR